MKMLRLVTLSLVFAATYVYTVAQSQMAAPAPSVVRWQAPGWSMFKAASYDPSTQALWIRFTSGREYVYHGVPPACSTAFFESQEKGVFFNRSIRRCYAAVRVDPPAGATGEAAGQPMAGSAQAAGTN